MNQLPRLHLDKIARPIGFAFSNARKGEKVTVACRATLISDDIMFYKIMDNVVQVLFNPANLIHDNVYQFLALLHADDCADIFVNDLAIKLKITPKRDIQQGDSVSLADIADIQSVEFVDIEIKETDVVICCLKIGWKFGLFFDCSVVNPSSGTLDLQALAQSLGELYRYLRFEHVYKTLETSEQYKILENDGWFPFIEIHGHEFKELVTIYESQRDIRERVADLVNRFDSQRMESITKKWWTKIAFKDKQSILEAGINAYLRNDEEGFILSCKTILSEIEGLIRIDSLSSTGTDVRKYQQIAEHVGEKAKGRDLPSSSLLLPSHFVNYLKSVIYQSFDLTSGSVNLSRHSSSHGVANPEDYTKERALQAILTLDQIFYFL